MAHFSAAFGRNQPDLGRLGYDKNGCVQKFAQRLHNCVQDLALSRLRKLAVDQKALRLSRSCDDGGTNLRRQPMR